MQQVTNEPASPPLAPLDPSSPPALAPPPSLAPSSAPLSSAPLSSGEPASLALDAEHAARKQAEMAASRLFKLQNITAEVARAVTPSDVEDVILSGVRAALGANGVSLWRVNGGEIVLVREAGYIQGQTDKYTSIPLDTPLPLGDVLRTGVPVWLESQQNALEEYPSIHAALQPSAHHAWAVIPLGLDDRPSAGLVLSFLTPRRFEADEREFLLAAARQCAQALERARLYEAEKRANKRLVLLAEVSSLVASSRDGLALLDPIAHLLVPTAADVCWVTLSEEDASLRAIAVAHRDPDLEELARQARQRFPPDPSRPHPIFEVVRSGKTQVIHRTPDARLRSFAHSDEHLRFLNEVILDSEGLFVPMIAGGQVIGALSLWRRGAPYDQGEIMFCEEFAHRAAAAVENARAYQAEREARLQAEREVAERKRVEAALREADRRKDEFLAMLGHELRNPLAPIRLAASVLKAQAPAALQRPVSIIERQAAHLTRLVDDLLEVSRITQGKITLQRGPTTLAEIVERAVESSRPQIDARRHQLTVSLPPRPVRLHADATRLAQVLTNLLNNASKYTDVGGRIALLVERAGAEVVIRVRDSGVGIPAEMLASIFDLFVQLDRSLDRSQGGLGIGLTMVRSLVEMHGGSVEARSEGNGKGSEFIVRLPALPDDDAGARPEGEAPALRARRILVVDANPDAAHTLAELLEMSGHDARVAFSEAEALDLAAAAPLDLVLLDVHTPRLRGHEVARALRAQHCGARLVALTGNTQEDDRQRLREAGFDAHIEKPVDYASLDALLASLR